MELGEVKLDGFKVFDSFGFGTLASVIIYFLLGRNQSLDSLHLETLEKLPTAIAVPMGAAMIFVFHILGRGLMAIGNTFAKDRASVRLKAEYNLATTNHPFAAATLAELKQRIRFIEGIFGLSSFIAALLCAEKVFSYFLYESKPLGFGWLETTLFVLLAIAARLSHHMTYMQIELVSLLFKNDRSEIII